MQTAALNKQQVINPGINKTNNESKKDLFLKEHYSSTHNSHFFDLDFDYPWYSDMQLYKGMRVFFNPNVKTSELKTGNMVLLIDKKSGSIVIRKVQSISKTYTLEYFYDGISDNYIPFDTRRFDLLGRVTATQRPWITHKIVNNELVRLDTTCTVQYSQK